MLSGRRATSSGKKPPGNFTVTSVLWKLKARSHRGRAISLSLSIILFFLMFGGHPCFGTSGDVCPGLQSQGGSLACFLACMILTFATGATPAH